MESNYNNLEKIKSDIESEFSFVDIAVRLGEMKDDELKGYMMCCPFHEEKTPSCQVGIQPGHLFFRCYGCGEKGNIYTYIMKKRNVSFIESLHIVADVVGTNLNLSNYNWRERKESLSKLEKIWNQYVVDYEDPELEEKARKQGLRFFPSQVGYDKENNRIVLPFIKNGNIIGFTKRAIGDEKPKWIHSSFKNSLIIECNNIYNFDSMKKYEKEESFLNIVEGPGDVSGMIKAGFNRTICICGTSNINQESIRNIRSQGVNSVNIIPDGDIPGRKAIFKWILELAKWDFQMLKNSYITILPEDKDPGEMYYQDIINCVDERQPALEYFLKNSESSELVRIYRNEKGYVSLKGEIFKWVSNKERLNDKQTYAYLLGNENITTHTIAKEREDDYKKRLMVIAGMENDEIGDIEIIDGITPEKAKRILKMRFGI